ncbi:hypothetical protein EK599_12870 [Vibrio sp. T187]|uniref:primosomal replication protein n=1 Tax=Vibrio TaxID=662 RepID=UPI0010C9D362|nr:MULTISPECIES: primosomal replication protein [Vibrio]MBW3696590.1 hypothetical protein [Vibrio sp. T187]
MSQFSELKHLLENIRTQCSHADQMRGTYHQALFDRNLFKCRAKKLLPCAMEAMQTYNTIVAEQTRNQLSAARAQHLTEHLTNQITALQRELVSQDLRDDKPIYTTADKTINQLYNDLAQHQDWSHRLQQLVAIKKDAYLHAPASLKNQAEQALDAAEQRLARCLDAMEKIDKKITLENPNHNHD